ncbi:MAG: nucleoside hydrolase, partial [Planctomycetaceae bacterium]
MAVKQKILIDADPGIGDAVAIALSLYDPQLDVVAVTATAGRVSGAVATRNTQAVIDELDPPKWPRVGGSAAHAPAAVIDFRATAVSASMLNGRDGLGDCELR